MRRSTFSLFAIGPLLAVTACGSQVAPQAASSSVAPPPVSSSAAPSTTASAKPVVAVPTCGPVTIPPLDKSAFSASTKITGNWMPLPVGSQWTLEGRANRGGGVLPHRIVFTVTDLVEVINGVPNVVTWDVDTDKGTVSEAELAFFAQDDNGNVWNFGEYPEEYKGGKFSAAPSTWLAGQNRAEAGVQVPAKVQIGTPEVLQGSSPTVNFLDCAKDVKTEDHVCVPTGCYDKVRVVDERSPLAPDTGVQTKSYAPGVGVVKVGAIADPEGETLVLAERKTLSPPELAKADAEARKIDRHGRDTHPVYKNASPLQGP
ncbi:hypothetical protein DMA12_07115 [Amycolatopsis balhimycina DSM 5908]|uniref:Uncharacterized protein n=1 Tax=Amycolatopsis balhimycina DSM 5908 TaxID=1081091 RepID=A0A428WZ03_AMYBA|nr:hypothetical protein [Amycolatopsis balhimycina]RSM48250.1 hypothetical protein DMA12_07115 [Amycolatopsis balhimycina DSM 5908]